MIFLFIITSVNYCYSSCYIFHLFNYNFYYIYTFQSCFTFNVMYSAVTNAYYYCNTLLPFRQSLQPVTMRQMITLTHTGGPGSVLSVQRPRLAKRSKPKFHHFRYTVPDPPLGRPIRSGVDVHTARTRCAQCASKRRVSSILWVECKY